MEGETRNPTGMSGNLKVVIGAGVPCREAVPGPPAGNEEGQEAPPGGRRRPGGGPAARARAGTNLKETKVRAGQTQRPILGQTGRLMDLSCPGLLGRLRGHAIE
jgi:hypothetical protein